MKTIYKYLVKLGDFTVDIPKNGRVLHVDVQENMPYMWVMVNPDAPPETRTFTVYGTGHPILPSPHLTHIGTFMLNRGTFVGHLFDTQPKGSNGN